MQWTSCLGLRQRKIVNTIRRWKNKKKVRLINGSFVIVITEEQAQKLKSSRRIVLTDSPDSNGTDLMRKIKVSDGDTIGIAVQQSDLPMIQFLLNGEPLNEQAVNRFRGTVYPSVFLPENDGLSVKLVFNEDDFRELTPHARFGPLIIARGLV
jgi:MoaA/NifB/PqqE/SkfB family radical SAM enzyme